MRLRISPIVLLLSLAGCEHPRSPVRIGVVLAGPGIEAARMALADANATPRARRAGITLQLMPIEVSSPTEPLRAIAAADVLSADPTVLAVLGHANSGASIAAAQIYNANGLPQVAPTTTAPLYTRAGPYSFRIVPDDSRQGRVLASILAADRARPRVAVVYVNDDYGRALRASLNNALDGTEARVVYESPITEGWSDEMMGLVARSVAEARPQVVAWLARPEDLRRFRALLRPLAPEASYLAGDATDSPTIYGPARRDFAGVRFIRFVNPTAPDSALQAFRARFRASRQQEATADVVLAYDAARLVAEVVLAGARTRAQVRAALALPPEGRRPFQGLAGPFGIDAHGNGVRPYLLAEVDTAGTVRSLGSF